jgi:hypothetical protein
MVAKEGFPTAQWKWFKMKPGEKVDLGIVCTEWVPALESNDNAEFDQITFRFPTSLSNVWGNSTIPDFRFKVHTDLLGKIYSDYKASLDRFSAGDDFLEWRMNFWKPDRDLAVTFSGLRSPEEIGRVTFPSIKTISRERITKRSLIRPITAACILKKHTNCGVPGG